MAESKWVTFTIAEEVFGFEIEYVREMLQLPDLHAIPGASADSMGVILLRSAIIPVFDLRKTLRLQDRQTRVDEVIETLTARLQDHTRYVTELKRCVNEHCEFTLTTDPHACAFGKWFDNFQTDDLVLSSIVRKIDAPHQQVHAVATDDSVLSSILRRIDSPHHQVHEVAHAVKDHDLSDDTKSAEVKIQAAYENVCHIFDEAIAQIRRHFHQSLVVIGSSAGTLAVAVDEIHSVVRCDDSDIQAPDAIPGVDDFPALIGVLPIKDTTKFILLLDPAQLYPQLIPTMQRVAP